MNKITCREDSNTISSSFGEVIGKVDPYNQLTAVHELYSSIANDVVELNEFIYDLKDKLSEVEHMINHINHNIEFNEDIVESKYVIEFPTFSMYTNVKPNLFQRIFIRMCLGGKVKERI